METSDRWSILESPYHWKSSRVHSQFLTIEDLPKLRPVRQCLVKFLVSNCCCRPRRQPSVNVVKPEELHNGPALKLFLLVTHLKLKWCIKHLRPCFTTSPNTERRVENMPRGRVFLKNFVVFRNVARRVLVWYIVSIRTKTKQKTQKYKKTEKSMLMTIRYPNTLRVMIFFWSPWWITITTKTNNVNTGV